MNLSFRPDSVMRSSPVPDGNGVSIDPPSLDPRKSSSSYPCPKTADFREVEELLQYKVRSPLAVDGNGVIVVPIGLKSLGPSSYLQSP